MIRFFIPISALYLISCSSNPKSEPFKLLWPTDQQVISRHYSGSHDGIDISIPSNTNIYASHKGQVTHAEYSKSYGNFIILEFSSEWATLYAHLNKFLVKKGEKIQARQKIGLSGATGIVSGAHLHFELFKNKENVNPISYLKK